MNDPMLRLVWDVVMWGALLALSAFLSLYMPIAFLFFLAYGYYFTKYLGMLIFVLYNTKDEYGINLFTEDE